MQSRVVHAGKRHGFHRVVGFAGDLGGLRRKAGFGPPFLQALDPEALNQRIAEQVAAEGFHLLAAERGRRIIADAVLHRRVDAQAVARDVQHQGGGVAGRAGLVVRDAGAEAHFHEPVRFGRQQGQGLQRGPLQDGIVPDSFIQQAANLGLAQTVHGENLDLAHLRHAEAQGLAQMLGRLAALGIVQPGMQACFHTIEHSRLPRSGFYVCGGNHSPRRGLGRSPAKRTDMIFKFNGSAD